MMQKSRFFLVICACAVGLLSGCTHELVRSESSLACHGIDWWEAGRTEGVTGAPLEKSLADTRARCASGNAQIDLDLFTNGHEAGLVEYCSPSQGLAVGRSGLEYEKSCPSYLEPAFLKQYELGLQLHRMELEHSSIDAIDPSSRSL